MRLSPYPPYGTAGDALNFDQVRCGDIFVANYGKALKADERNLSGLYAVFGSSGKVGTHDEALTEDSTLIIGRKGSVGKIVFADHGGWIIDTAFYTSLIDPESVNLRYLYYALRQARLADRTITTSIPGLNRDDLYNTKIPLPPLEEQRRIAAILDKADAIRRKRQQAIELTEAFLRSVFLDMFGDPESSWRKDSFVEVAEPKKNSFVNGPFGSNLLTSELQRHGVPVIYIQDIRTGHYARKSDRHVTEYKADELESCEVLGGDVLVAKVGDPPGSAAIYPVGNPRAIVTQDVVRIRPNLNEVTSEFLVSFFNSQFGRYWLKPIIVEATRSRFGLGEIKKLDFTFPPLELQEEFSDIFRECLKKIEAEKSHKMRLDNLFSALSQKAFKGELTSSTDLKEALSA